MGNHKIEWHRERLKIKKLLAAKAVEMEKYFHDRAKNLSAETAQYEAQIRDAEARGLKSFDRRLLIGGE